MELERLKLIENDIISGLKDFQKATVDRIFELFCQGKQEKVLIADEVGLGKTLVAKGVIARLARHYKELGKESFQVAYICSNLSIAQQNMEKLRIGRDVKVDKEAATRLSMQALRIFEQQKRLQEENGYIQLAAMTPGTSFHLTAGGGTFHERAFIFALLKKTGLFDDYLRELDDFLSIGVKYWSPAKRGIEERIENLGQEFDGKVISRIRNYLKTDGAELYNDILWECDIIKSGEFYYGASYALIGKLRWMMAVISLEFLKPDLVIMDEFQRFRDLIVADSESEIGMLTQNFIHRSGIKTLLLSATPYKLYSTLEEIEEQGEEDDHYREFWEVVDFLFRDKPDQSKRLKDVWEDYSSQLRMIDLDKLNQVLDFKEEAESILYEVLCRTERLRVSESGDAMQDTKKAVEPVKVREDDIKTYMAAAQLVEALQEYGRNVPQPVEYVKSAPYIFSFMEHYKLKKELKRAYEQNPELEKDLKKSRSCWIKRNDVNKYKRIKFPNARLRHLEEEAFSSNGAYLLWVPPSLPYYEPAGPFRQSEGFSKILVFSAWAMVPRMIATLISYEAERRTIGTPTYKADSEQEGRKLYFAKEKRRFPYPKLKFKAAKKEEELSGGRPESMSLFTLLNPAPSMTGLFDPIETLNNFNAKGEKAALKTLEKEIQSKLEEFLAPLQDEYPPSFGRTGLGWYWAAPILMDMAMGYDEIVSSWIDYVIEEQEKEGREKDNPEIRHLHFLQKVAAGQEKLELGPVPRDLSKVLAWQVLASPAACALRAMLQGGLPQEFKENLPFMMREAYRIGKRFMALFNRPEATAVVDILYGKKYDEQYWRNVLRYCLDGNLQAVLDEYKHMLVESHGLWNDELSDQALSWSRLMQEAMEISTASYKIDTLESFLDSFNENKKINLRSHYAAGFYEIKSHDEKGSQRTGRLRSSFNSPFRPFVLATTSIGQEGLDFHYYCRKVMHWNLPGNPVELEQREGRVNRYKNIAIRQNIASWHDNIKFEKEPWREMFIKCREDLQDKYCELAPYWHLEPSREDENRFAIERIVSKYPYSRDEQQYERLIRLLSIYRISMGQARQEELLEYILQNFEDEELEEVKRLFMNLSPYYR